ncbi:uncharacterized protein LOC144100034 [Amblyomma americanum]
MCTIKAPRSIGLSTNYITQTLPNETVCDYIVLDIVQAQDGSYNQTHYYFLRNLSSKYLFTLTPSATLTQLEATVSASSFVNTASRIRQVLDLRGFGILPSVPLVPQQWTIGNTNTLRSIYQNLRNVLTTVNASSVYNFYAITAHFLSRDYYQYERFMQEINGVADMVIVLTIADTSTLEAEAPSSWDKSCFFNSRQPPLQEAVFLIDSVQSPQNHFALTLTLRMDVFIGVNITDIHQQRATASLAGVRSTSRSSASFETECVSGVYTRGAFLMYFPFGSCVFAKYSYGSLSGVATFDTATTIQMKMKRAIGMLIQRNASSRVVMGWLAHDVTFNLAPPTCGGKWSRLLKMRQVIG